jgi:hypothetical protein
MGPASKAISWNMHFVNGYKFHTQEWSNGKKTTNCGVHVKGITEGGEDDYYGIIQHIFQLEYEDLSNKITLFYCQWFDPTKTRGTRVHPQYNIVDIKMDRHYALYDPFILAQKVRQVYYVPYPDMCKDMRGWSVAISTKPRGHVEIEIVEDEIPYQCDDMSPTVPVTELEILHGLADATLIEEVEMIIDPNNDLMDHDGQSEDDDDEEESDGEDNEDEENEDEDEDDDDYDDI